MSVSLLQATASDGILLYQPIQVIHLL